MTRLSSLKGTLASTFGAAAEAYHSAADVQREVASRLARRISDLALPPAPRILEIGCGTGFLAQALAPEMTGARWIVSDLSEAMVRRARATLEHRAAGFAVMDGEAPAARPESFELVCASLVFQWFEDLQGSLGRLARLLAPGGALAFSTLTAGSFPEWRAAHREIGAWPAMRSYPSAGALRGMLPSAFRVAVETDTVRRSYRNAHAFLAHWKEIGTHVPGAGRPPLTPGTMRRLLRRFESGITVTYEVAYATAVRS